MKIGKSKIKKLHHEFAICIRWQTSAFIHQFSQRLLLKNIKMLRHFVSKTAIPVQINITTTSTVIRNKPIHSSNTNSNNSKNNNGWWTQSYPQGGYKKITKVVK